MHQLNEWLRHLEHNYALIAIGAILFFGLKSIVGYFTYRKFKKELSDIKNIVKELRHK